MATTTGNDGNNILNGTNGRDIIFGRAGDDTIYGLALQLHRSIWRYLGLRDLL